MPNEADTCRRYVVPKLQSVGWDNEPHRINEQVTFTDGRIVVTGRQGRRRPGKRCDTAPTSPSPSWSRKRATRTSLNPATRL
jgi:hypothetical protein